MSKISDELREIADECLIGPTNRRVRRLAVRIDREMMERPLAADGKLLVDGETVYDSNGHKYHVNEVCPLVNVSTDTHSCLMYPDRFTHELPDSFERIADELDDWRKGAVEERRIRTSDNDDVNDFIDRIRKLAKERGDE